MRQSGETTKARIMDAAEALFAERGYDAVSVREFMDAADAKLGLFSYHFGTKEALFEAVISRRIHVLGSRRRELLGAFADTESSSVEKVVEAFVQPYLELMIQGEQGWRAYGKIAAYVAQSARWADLVARYFNDTARLFIDELCAIMPGTSRADITRSFVFSIGAMLNIFAMTGRLNSLMNETSVDENLASLYPDLKRFMTAGIMAVAKNTE